MDAKRVRDSKFLSRVLRHEPERIGMALDGAGWADVADLCAKSRGRLTPARIAEFVAGGDKPRFELSADGARIRAVHGHSVEVDVLAPASPPPEILYHGTAPAALEAILREGIKPMLRRHAHLSETIEQARAVGRRHCRGGAPAILEVAAAALAAKGAAFHRSTSGVWLCAEVPPAALRLIESG